MLTPHDPSCARQAPGLPSTARTVMVVDDDPLLRMIAETYFSGRGALKVYMAVNGKHALELLEKGDEDIAFILLDLSMPVMDGVQFLRLLQQRGYGGSIALISGESPAVLSLAGDIAERHGLQIAGSLTKPFNAQALDKILCVADSMVASPHRNEAPQALSRSELESALSNDQITAHYQPIVSASSNAFVGVEVLARWPHPVKGAISPGLFIPMAESNGLITQLTLAVTKRAIEGRKCLAPLNSDFTMSINLSAIVLSDLSLPDRIAQMVDDSSQQRSNFVFEITESQMLDDTSFPLEVLARLNLMGFALSIDDFGTKFSNLDQLHKIPFQELKIDHSFAHLARTDERARASVTSCVSLGKELGLRLVAEGIETSQDRELMEGLGVDKLQGFGIAKPMPLDDLADWIVDYQNCPKWRIEQTPVQCDGAPPRAS